MIISGLALSEHLPAADSRKTTTILLVGGDDVIAAALCRSGYQVARHKLDTGPLVQLAGLPFTPPAIDWPFATAAFAAVILLDELALVVREEDALAEAARVLRPGGILLLRVPATGRLAWLDGDNAYRYIRDITRRGCPLPTMAGVGWRRHYRRDDLHGLLRPHFRVRKIRGLGLGLSDAARLALNVVYRWLLRSWRGDEAISSVPAILARHEGRLSLAGRGYWLVAAAECVRTHEGAIPRNLHEESRRFGVRIQRTDEIPPAS